MKYLLIGVIGLMAGLILARTFLPESTPENPVNASLSMPLMSSPANQDEAEALLAEIRQIKLELEQLLQDETNRFAQLAGDAEGLIASLEQDGPLANQGENQRRNGNRTLGNAEYGKDTLIDAGLTEVESERILELEAIARDRIQELLADPDSRNRESIREVARETSTQIRSELGDYGYENYLAATGRDTSVSVGNVSPDSAGAIAGLQAGDEILSYGGERVFDINDLQSATTSGTEGETVVVELVRDDQPVTLVIPRGEIGISTRGRGRNN